MWDDDLREELEEFIGKKIRDDIDLDDITFPKAYKGYINDNSIDEEGNGTLEVCVVSKRYENYGEARNWTANHSLFIDVSDFVIEDIGISDTVYGDDGLGEYDPSEVFSAEAYFTQSIRFLRKIVEKE